jgi:hypothetical protein
LSDEELFEEMLQEADRLHEIDPGGVLSNAKFDALVEEHTFRVEQADEKEPVMTEDEELEFRFRLMDKIRQRRHPPSPTSPPESMTTDHTYEGCPQCGEEPDSPAR